MYNRLQIWQLEKPSTDVWEMIIVQDRLQP
jgi:hypothetical protein